MLKLTPFALIFALILAGCEPVTPPTTVLPPDPPDPPPVSGGAWEPAAWLAWLNTRSENRLTGDGWIGGVGYSETAVTAWCDWAAEYFPTGIPKNPAGGEAAWAQNTLAPNRSAGWRRYMEENPEIAAAFPGNFDEFCFWAEEWFQGVDIPTVPPDVPAPSLYLQPAFTPSFSPSTNGAANSDATYADAGLVNDL